MLMTHYGNCGGPIPHNGLLPILVGEPADRCPTAVMLADPEIQILCDQVPSWRGPGSLSVVPVQTLPPDLRAYVEEAAGWLAEWRASEVNHGG